MSDDSVQIYSGGMKSSGWPSRNDHSIREIASESKMTLSGLKASSPCKDLDAYPSWGMMHLLFPKSCLVCMGASISNFHTVPLGEIDHETEDLVHVVPRTMTKQFGMTKKKKNSERCNDNTGPALYQVIEFDNMADDEQAAILWRLSEYLPLVLVHHSGSESLHGWFYAKGATENRLEQFQRYAASRGADPALFTKSQMGRVPNGMRPDTGRKQELLYLDLNTLRKFKDDPGMLGDFPMAPEVEDSGRPVAGLQVQEWNEFKVNCPPEPAQLIEGFLHLGSKGVIAGQSKVGKSHLAIQLVHAVSCGIPFLGMETIKSKTVYVNLEVQDFCCKKRFESVIKKTGMEPDSGFLSVVNARGTWQGLSSLDTLIDQIPQDTGLIVIDPFYKLNDSDETDQAGVKLVLRKIDGVIHKTGAAVIYLHHFTKGNPKDKNLIDLLSGSGVLSRDYDSCNLLMAVGDCRVDAKFVLRNHSPLPDILLERDYPLLKAVPINEGGVFKSNDPTQCILDSLEDGELSRKDLQDRVCNDHGIKKKVFDKALSEMKSKVNTQKSGNKTMYSKPS